MDVVTLGEVKKVRKDLEAIQLIMSSVSERVSDLSLSVDKLMELTVLTGITGELEYLASEVLSVDIPYQSNKFVIKSVFIEGDIGLTFRVDIINSVSVGAFVTYSNQSAGNEIYDVVSLPYFDEDSTNKLHIKIKNLSTVKGKMKVRVAGVVM